MAGHDDVYMVGRPQDCVAAYATFAGEAAALGLTVDAAESRIFSLAEGTVAQGDQAESSDYTGVAVPVPHTEGVVVFETPIGHPEWVQVKLRGLISAHRVALRGLPTLGSAQVSQHLIAASHSARVAHLLRTLPPKVSEAFALAHDDQMWVAFGHVLGYLSGPATRAALQPLVENGEWPAREGHWLQAALGEPLHTVVHGPKATDADWAFRQAQLRRSDGGCSIGNAHSTREAAFVGSWALAIQEEVLTDFPAMGAAVGAAPAERGPHVRALAEAWESVAPWVPLGSVSRCSGGPEGHTDHGGLACLQALCPCGGARGQSGRFASHLQRRLMKNAQTEALEDMYDDASQAWQLQRLPEGRAMARHRWGRLIATSGAYAHSALTALPASKDEPGHRNMDSRSMSVWACFRLGIPPPLMRGTSRLRVCRLHGHEQCLTDDLGYHSVHCGRLTPHIMHSGLEDGFVYAAGNAPALRVTVEAVVFAGSGSRMDVVLTNPTGDQQTLYVDVTMGTAMGDRDYAGTPRNGYRREPGWRGVAGSAARRAEAGKHVKYAARVREAGAAQFEGACVEDFGTWGLGARAVLRFIADAAYGERPSPVKDLFVWKAAQHIGVAAANAVVKAHDANVLLMRDLAPEVLLARYGRGGPDPEVMEAARAGVAYRYGPESRDQAAPRSRPSRCASSARRRIPIRGGAPSADSRTNHMSLGASSDSLLHLSTRPSGMRVRHEAGPLMTGVGA